MGHHIDRLDQKNHEGFGGGLGVHCEQGAGEAQGGFDFGNRRGLRALGRSPVYSFGPE